MKRSGEGLFKAVILMEIYYKGWRDLDRPNWSSYIGGEIWRGLFEAIILAEIYYKGWIDLEKAIWSFYI